MSESTVFVVRVWRGAEAFRATARPVDHEGTRTFAEPLALLRFLQAGHASATDAAMDPSPSVAPRVRAQRNRR